ncbi:MAG: RES domain-containing protein [Tabrizicola sp.]|nr:RES domain-containing protein [Tabrizicola sp.]
MGRARDQILHPRRRPAPRDLRASSDRRKSPRPAKFRPLRRCRHRPHRRRRPLAPRTRPGPAASTWKVSDRARASGADGMIYTARSEPDRWHLALFRWPGSGLTGRVLPYPLPG